MYGIFWTIRHTFPPKIWEENGGASYRLNVAYLAHRGGQWSGVTGGRSRVTTAGSQQRQERVSQWWEAREAGAESPLHHTTVLGRRVQVVQAR